jgi:DDE superfamily endonuclease
MKKCTNWLDFVDACRYSFGCLNSIEGRRLPWHAAAHRRWLSSCPPQNARPWSAGSARPRWLPAWPVGGRLSFCWPTGARNPRWPSWSGSNAGSCASGPNGSWPSVWRGWLTPLAVGPRGVFPPEVAIHVVRLACERPDPLGRSLSQWDCPELARQLIAEGIVEEISAATVRRILAAHQLKPWRQHVWLYPKHPRDAAFYATISELIELYTRPLRPDEMVLSVDEKTSLQPRPRLSPTRPAQPQNLPNRHEHEYRRAGALNLFAAFDTRSGKVYGHCYDRKRQREFIAFLEALDTELDTTIRTIHLVCDNVSTHHGKEVRQWFAKHPRFIVHFTPVHCSWMNQVEQWFSILQRKRLRIVDFDSKDHLRAKIAQFMQDWNHHAHPFNWSTKSVAKVMAAAPALAA